MSRLVVLRLNGDLVQTGFQVTVEVAQDGHYPALSEEGALPASPELSQALTDWKTAYGTLAQPGRDIKPHKIHYDGSLDPIEACIDSAKQLTQTFRHWLQSQSFLQLELQLRRVLSPNDVIRVVVRSPDCLLQNLPWHLWPFVDDYPRAEVAIGSARFQRGVEETAWQASMTPKVTILAVLGDRQNIDVERDRRLLNALPGAQVTVLVEPEAQALHEQLYQKPWDIVFFAGHSDTCQDGEGILRLNPTTSLTIAELRYAVRQAVANGLQLAIFNSCNGLGLAQALSDLQLPQMIVMREVIPDHVAHKFLEYFLDAFARGLSFYQSVRYARECLAGLEKVYPCASWLPVIYQHPGRTPPDWEDLQQTLATPALLKARAPAAGPPSWSLSRLALTSFFLTSLVMGVRFLGGLQWPEFSTYDHLMRLRPEEGRDNRILLVTIDEADLQYQNENGYQRTGSSLSNEALTIAIDKLSPHNPSVIGLDIFRESFPAKDLNPMGKKTTLDSEAVSAILEAKLATRLLAVSAIERPEPIPLTFICQTKMGDRLSPIPPPDEADKFGFSNIVRDPDWRIRRHLIGMAPGLKCQTDKSFSYQVSRYYLQKQQKWQAERSNGVLTINEVALRKLRAHFGPYNAVEMGGYSTLLNYRSTREIADSISLSDLLSGERNAELAGLVRDRIVLIGTTAHSFKDYHLTPYGEMAGVEIQAHMISQLISAVLDKRPIIKVLPQVIDVLWVYAWVIATGAVFSRLSQRLYVAITVSAILAGIGLFCFIALILGWWLPLIPAFLGCVAMILVTYSIPNISEVREGKVRGKSTSKIHTFQS